ncbi:hypothetical protein [Methanocrinis sp.]|uniref:hypothetical protein n=1 Tax=Methanocrinis sp. TaxID=3101522 RepID=UPI003D0A6662
MGQSPTEEWNLTFGGAGGDEGKDILAIEGGYVIAGSTAGDAGKSSVLLIKTDSNGTEIWNASFNPSNGAEGNAILETDDGGYVIAGSAQVSDRYASILKAGSDVGAYELEDVAEEATFGEPDLKETADGGYVLTVSIERESGRDLRLTRMDSDWNEIWNETVMLSEISGYWICATSDGGKIVVDQKGTVRLTDVSGSEIWSSELGGAASLEMEDGSRIAADIVNSEEKKSLQLIKTESDGSEAWKKTFDISEPVDRELNEDGTITIDRSELYNAILAGDEKVLITKTGSDGNETSVAIGLSKMEGYSVQRLADGGYIFADPGLGRAGLAKIDPDGEEAWTAEFDLSVWEGSYEVVNLSDGGQILIAPEGDGAVLAEVDSEGFEIWSVEFELSGTEGGYRVLELEDGGSLLIAPECYQVLLLRLNPEGGAVWREELNRTGWDGGYGFYEYDDGDYVIVTTTISDPDQELLLMKVDSDGNETWARTFGEASSSEEGFDVDMASDGGYVAVGASEAEGRCDLLLLKFDSEGEEVWTKRFNRSDADRGSSVQVTGDGGYIIAGTTETEEDGSDLWLLKVDQNGEQVWERTYGGTGDDEGFCARETADGGYILVGSRQAFGGLGKNLWLLKTDALGNEVWNNRFGGAGDQLGLSVLETEDLGFIIAGYTDGTDGGDADALIIKTGSDGSLLREMTLGGTGHDEAGAVVETDDGGYAFTGLTESFGAEGRDVWLVRLS